LITLLKRIAEIENRQHTVEKKQQQVRRSKHGVAVPSHFGKGSSTNSTLPTSSKYPS